MSPQSRESRELEALDIEIREVEQRLFVLRATKVDWLREQREVEFEKQLKVVKESAQRCWPPAYLLGTRLAPWPWQLYCGGCKDIVTMADESEYWVHSDHSTVSK